MPPGLLELGWGLLGCTCRKGPSSDGSQEAGRAGSCRRSLSCAAGCPSARAAGQDPLPAVPRPPPAPQVRAFSGPTHVRAVPDPAHSSFRISCMMQRPKPPCNRVLGLPGEGDGLWGLGCGPAPSPAATSSGPLGLLPQRAPSQVSPRRGLAASQLSSGRLSQMQGSAAGIIAPWAASKDT